MDNETLINSYFEGNLTPHQKLLFDQLIETDKDFAESVSLEKKIKAAITIDSRGVLKAKLKTFENTTPKKSNQKNWLYIAASIVVLLGVSLFFMNQSPSGEKLYAAYFKPYPNTVAPVVRSGSTQNIKNEAFSAYETGEYDKAVHLFGELANSTEEEYALFYKSISLMMIDKTNKASSILSDTTWSEAYQKKAIWYLTLCYLKQGETEKTKVLLKNIMAEKSYNHENAKNLLKRLE